MKLTPLDIRHKEFRRGLRGYADSEVDEFLDEVADEFERLFKENIDLSEQVESLQEKVDQYRNLEETLQKTLISAQKSAEELKANAQKEAQLILREAEMKARAMVNDSYADKQAVEKQIVMLKGAQEEFRFKFRSLLEGYIKALDELDTVAKTDNEAALRRAAEATLGGEGGEPQGTTLAAAPTGRPTGTAGEDASHGMSGERAEAQAEPAEAEALGQETHGRTDAQAELLDDDLLADVETEVDKHEFDW